jgi:hypothetical protein
VGHGVWTRGTWSLLQLTAGNLYARHSPDDDHTMHDITTALRIGTRWSLSSGWHRSAHLVDRMPGAPNLQDRPGRLPIALR